MVLRIRRSKDTIFIIIPLEEDTPVDFRDDTKLTKTNSMSISRALDTNNINLLREAIKTGDDVNKVIHKPSGLTPLHIAVKNGKLDIVQELLMNGANPNLTDSRGNTPLHVAAQYSSLEINDVLIKNGADVNTKNKNEEIPLHVVGKNKENVAPIAAIHINNGANINAPDIRNNMPKDNKVFSDNMKTIEAHLDSIKTKDALQNLTAIDRNVNDVIDRILENHFEIDPTKKATDVGIEGGEKPKIENNSINDTPYLKDFSKAQLSPKMKENLGKPKSKTPKKPISRSPKKGGGHKH